jgi:hypothetical protein
MGKYAHRIYQMAIKYYKLFKNAKIIHKIYTNYFHSPAFKNMPKFGFLVCKYVHIGTVWQPCM